MEGVEMGVDQNGILLIETAQGTKKIISGDVSLKVIA
jgi:hypothetical protein